MAKVLVGKEDVEVPDGSIVELNYYIVKENIFYEELNARHVSYGIEIEKVANQFSNHERNFLRDITCNRKEILRIADLLRKNKVMPVHLKDVMEDFI